MRFFHVAVLSCSALLALACGSNVIHDDDGNGGGDCGEPPPPGAGGYCPPAWVCMDGEWQETAGACPEPECPASEPVGDVACEMEGQDCTYNVEVGCDVGPAVATYRCMNGSWVELQNFCSPPPECPETLPVDGSDCTGWDFAFDCFYDIAVECSAEPDVASAWCDGPTSLWSVDMAPSCGGCGYVDAASCEADDSCRWLVAADGCDNTALPVERCAPIADCTPDSCGDGATCVSYDVNPCWIEQCPGACGVASVCEPLAAP